MPPFALLVFLVFASRPTKGCFEKPRKREMTHFKKWLLTRLVELGNMAVAAAAVSLQLAAEAQLDSSIELGRFVAKVN